MRLRSSPRFKKPLDFSTSVIMQRLCRLLLNSFNSKITYGHRIIQFFTQSAFLKDMMLGEIPTDTLDCIYILNPTYVTVILLIMIAMCFALTFLSMCLYFQHQKYPSIKATSSTLSSCLFIGCYFLLAQSLFHTVNSEIIWQRMGKSYQAFICMFDIYLLVINISTDIVLAAVIAKPCASIIIFSKSLVNSIRFVLTKVSSFWS